MERGTSLVGERLLQLRLVHRGPSLDAALPGLVVELVVRGSLRAAVRAQAAAPGGGDVVQRGAARRLGLAVPGPFLVDGAGRDLLGAVLAVSALPRGFLDVLVLPLALGT